MIINDRICSGIFNEIYKKVKGTLKCFQFYFITHFLPLVSPVFILNPLIISNIYSDFTHFLTEITHSVTIYSNSFLRFTSNGGYTTPFSVTTAVIYLWSVTSKAGLYVLIPSGAIGV